MGAEAAMTLRLAKIVHMAEPSTRSSRSSPPKKWVANRQGALALAGRIETWTPERLDDTIDVAVPSNPGPRRSGFSHPSFAGHRTQTAWSVDPRNRDGHGSTAKSGSSRLEADPAEAPRIGAEAGDHRCGPAARHGRRSRPNGECPVRQRESIDSPLGGATPLRLFGPHGSNAFSGEAAESGLR